MCTDTEKAKKNGHLQLVLRLKMSQVLKRVSKDMQKGEDIMSKKSDTSKVKILELIALTGEMNSNEIKSFFNSSSYIEKVITELKKESFIKKFKTEDKSVLRLTAKGKGYLKEILPDIFEKLLSGQKSMNRVRNDKRRNDRRDKLTDILNMFHRADVKIFPDEKVLLRDNSVNTRADNTDTYRREFYTSSEIKSIVPDYKNSIGSRAMGILAANSKLYIIYSTVDGDLFWRQDTEKNFYINTKKILSERLFGGSCETYLFVLADKPQTAMTLCKRYSGQRQGKIYPSDELPMIFALKNTEADATLKLILQKECVIESLTEIFKRELVFDKKYGFFDGVRKSKYKDEHGFIKERETGYVLAFLFEPGRIAQAIAVSKFLEVNIICFDYQREYIELYLENNDLGINRKIDILSNSVEDYKENYLK